MADSTEKRFYAFAGCVIAALVVIALVNLYQAHAKAPHIESLTYSQFLDDLQQGRVRRVTLSGHEIDGFLADASPFRSYAADDPDLIKELRSRGVAITAVAPPAASAVGGVLQGLLPMLLLAAFAIWFISRSPGSGSRMAGLGKSKARPLVQAQDRVTFADVAGADEAREALKEIVDFLRDPTQARRLGGRIPRGVLLVGPPGTGKTLLARAVAGEANVPFFSISGSSFVEMFVGVGAARVRDLFEQARKHAPCIVFVDEIDAVGRRRGAGVGGGNDEREQTLNQLLVEMDGFEPNSGVIVVAATNRADVLDKALMRPGRFDRQVSVGLPDIRGREQILNVHMRKVPISTDVEASVLARGTPGFSGADLANLVNEAALFAARRNKRTVEMQDFEDAKDKIYMGPERKSMVMREEERRNTAYHESGHAVVAKLLPKADPVHKVTIMPRGWALGLTWQLPEHDNISGYKDKMLEEISILFGGRIAEEIFVGQMSTGASNDFARATKIARSMVMRFGMSDALGTMVYVETEQDNNWHKPIAEATQQRVDAEIRSILDEQYALAKKLLTENRDKVEAMTRALLEWETIDADQVNDIMAGNEPRPPKDTRLTRKPLPGTPPNDMKPGAPATV